MHVNLVAGKACTCVTHNCIHTSMQKQSSQIWDSSHMWDHRREHWHPRGWWLGLWVVGREEEGTESDHQWCMLGGERGIWVICMRLADIHCPPPVHVDTNSLLVMHKYKGTYFKKQCITVVPSVVKQWYNMANWLFCASCKSPNFWFVIWGRTDQKQERRMEKEKRRIHMDVSLL